MSDFEDCQVVFSHDFLWDSFQGWLAGRGLKTFRIPIPAEDDLPTYGITFAHEQRL